MYCTQCGQAMPDSSRFCSVCGKPTAFQRPAGDVQRGSAEELPHPENSTSSQFKTQGQVLTGAVPVAQRNLIIGIVVAGVVMVLVIYLLFVRESEAMQWLKDVYPKGTSAYEFGCELDPSTAAGLDWSPGIGFSYSDLEDAWRKYC